MPSGSCLCGEIKVSLVGDPKFTATCYCYDDRKIGGAPVWQVPEENFKVESGTPKIFTKVSDFGREISTHFCPTCGTHLFRTGGSPTVKGMVGFRTGVLDDQSLVGTPEMEVFVERRPEWITPIPGAIQLDSKYQPTTAASTVKAIVKMGLPRVWERLLGS